METKELALNMLTKVKQPEPSFTTEDGKEKRVFNFPKVGVIPVPNISTTPILDEFTRRQAENPRYVFKETFKTHHFLNLQNITSGAIIAMGLYSLKSAINYIKKLKK